jgi:hypothetical protein
VPNWFGATSACCDVASIQPRRSLAAAVSFGICAINIWFVVAVDTPRCACVAGPRLADERGTCDRPDLMPAFEGQYAMILFGALASV